MMHLPIMQKRFSPIPTGQMARHLSKAINLPVTSAWYAAHAGLLLASHLATFETPSHSFLLAIPYCNIQSCHAMESTPPGPAVPCILAAMFSTVSSVTSMSMRTGSVSYSQSASSDSCVGEGCLLRSTSSTGRPVLEHVLVG
eukprot:15343843-Ditylum_brightwellii.AAC.2